MTIDPGVILVFALWMTIRAARPDDVPTVLRYIRHLAEYEKRLDEVVATEEGLHRALFGPRPAAEVVFGCLGDEIIAFALFFQSFSTFLGRPGLHLEDLFVLPEHRGKGYGKELLAYGARLCVDRNFGRYEWTVLDWNEPAIRFYMSQGATILPDWKICRVTGAELKKLAGR